MAYQVHDANGAYLGEPRTLPESGRKPLYPLKDMYIGQWISVPYGEQYRMLRAVRNIKYKRGLVFQVLLGVDGNWVVLRVK